MSDFFVYILYCSYDSYYIGHTDCIEQRLADHSSGKFDGYTAARLPIQLVFLQSFQTRDEAFVAERRIKKWTRKKKEALIDARWDELQKLAKKIFKKSFELSDIRSNPSIHFGVPKHSGRAVIHSEVLDEIGN